MVKFKSILLIMCAICALYKVYSYMIFAYDDRSNVEEEMFLCYECIENGHETQSQNVYIYKNAIYSQKCIYFEKYWCIYLCISNIFCTFAVDLLLVV